MVKPQPRMLSNGETQFDDGSAKTLIVPRVLLYAACLSRT